MSEADEGRAALKGQVVALEARCRAYAAQVARLEAREASLEKDLALYKGIAEFSYAWETWKTPEGAYVYVSPSCERMTGYAPEDFLRDPELMERMVHPADLAAVGGHFRARGPEKGLFHQDFRIIDRKGREHWISHYSQPVFGPGGAYLGHRESNRDITERKAVEACLERANRALKMYSECSQAIIRATNETGLLREVCGLVVEAGGYVLAWVGFAREDTQRSVVPVAEAGFGRDYLENLGVTWARSERGRGPTGTAIRTGRPSVCRNILKEPRFAPWRAEALKRGYNSVIALPLISEGKTFGALTIYAAEPDAFDRDEINLLSELADDLAHGIGALRNRLERQRVEQALKAREAQYRGIVEDQSELICRFLPGGTLTFVNEAYCRYFGRSREELVGASFMPLVPEEDRGLIEACLEGLSRDAPAASVEHRVLTPGGEIRWLNWTNRLILDAKDRIAGYQAVGRDITERKAAEEASRREAEKIRLFAYSISHDLKSPAIGIHGLTRRLKEKFAENLPEKGQTYCEQILKAGEQIVALVEQINLYIAAKEMQLRVDRVRLDQVLAMVREEFASRLSLHSVGWSQPEEMPEVRLDRLAALRILRNLVDNALKYGGQILDQIRIGYRLEGGAHVLSVSDNGVGIKPEDCEKIFDLFARQAETASVPGTGLGLAIVKELAEKHGGRVWVESTPDGWTTFNVSFSMDL